MRITRLTRRGMGQHAFLVQTGQEKAEHFTQGWPFIRCPSAPCVAAGGRTMLWRHIHNLAKSSQFVVARSCRCRKFAANLRKEAATHAIRLDLSLGLK